MAITDNLSFFLSCEEASGTRVDAHAGRNFTETGGTISSTTGIVGTGALFPSSGVVYLARASESALQPGPDFTFQCWFNGVGANMLQYAQLAGKDDTSGQRQWQLHLRGDTHTWAPATFDSVSGNNFADGVGSWSDSTNYHVIFTYDSADKNWRLYLNNSLHLTSSTPLTNGIKTDGTSAIWIGNRPSGGAARYAGMMDLIAYWKGRVITADDRTWLFNSGNGRSYAEMAQFSTDLMAQICL